METTQPAAIVANDLDNISARLAELSLILKKLGGGDIPSQYRLRLVKELNDIAKDCDNVGVISIGHGGSRQTLKILRELEKHAEVEKRRFNISYLGALWLGPENPKTGLRSILGIYPVSRIEPSDDSYLINYSKSRQLSEFETPLYDKLFLMEDYGGKTSAQSALIGVLPYIKKWTNEVHVITSIAKGSFPNRAGFVYKRLLGPSKYLERHMNDLFEKHRKCLEKYVSQDVSSYNDSHIFREADDLRRHLKQKSQCVDTNSRMLEKAIT